MITEDNYDPNAPKGTWKNPTCVSGVAPGWQPIVDRLEILLDYAGVLYTVDQVKEKFGGLRVYLSYTNLENEDKNILNRELGEALVTWAERKAQYTCEICGEWGEKTTDQFWLKTLCNKCNDERNAKIDKRK